MIIQEKHWTENCWSSSFKKFASHNEQESLQPTKNIYRNARDIPTCHAKVYVNDVHGLKDASGLMFYKFQSLITLGCVYISQD